MNPWVELYRGHAERRRTGQAVSGAIRERLIRLAKLERCSSSIEGRFTYRKGVVGRREWYIRGEDPQADAEPIFLADLSDARLSVQLTTDSAERHVHEFSAAVSGKTHAGTAWTVAIHLEDDRGASKELPHPEQKGDGACSHAVVHCHVGPDLDALPKVRVPFPAVGPADALDWLLATVVSGLEPMPWASLNEHLAKAKT